MGAANGGHRGAFDLGGMEVDDPLETMVTDGGLLEDNGAVEHEGKALPSSVSPASTDYPFSSRGDDSQDDDDEEEDAAAVWGRMLSTPLDCDSSPSAADSTFFATPSTRGRASRDSVTELLRRSSDLVDAWPALDFEFTRTIQKAPANHGSVDLMRRSKRAGGGMVAVKRMPTDWMMSGHAEFVKHRPRTHEQPWMDICIVKYLHAQGYPYVCEPHGVFRCGPTTYVVTSYADRGDLFSRIELFLPVGAPREAQIRPIVRQLVSAVTMLHDIGIAHRDLSPENIVLTTGGDGELEAKLIDFGAATFERMSAGVHGKPATEAPEMHSGVKYDAFLSDAFSLGVVIYAMAAQDYPWASTRPGRCQFFEFISTKGLKSFCARRVSASDSTKYLIDVLSDDIVELIEGLLAKDPSNRLNLGEAAFARKVGGPGTVMESAWLWHYDEPAPEARKKRAMFDWGWQCTGSKSDE